MSLIEVLISMFVLLFGLLGVAAIFPVGNHYVVEGEKFDLASGIAQNAFEELRARGMLRPEVWLYASNPPGNKGLNPIIPTPLPYPAEHPLVMQDSFGLTPGAFNVIDSIVMPGRAFVIDPLGTAAGVNEGLPNLDVFPYYNLNAAAVNVGMPVAWRTATGGPFPEERWPVRRISLPVPDTTALFSFADMPKSVAETIFRLRDDLAVEQPDESDRPSIQRWDTADPNNTPDILTDDTLLRRQYRGIYTWLATIVPTTTEGLEALQPANADFGEISYDVSVVVFRGREETPSATSERLIEAELLLGGELVIYSTNGTFAKDEVDAAVEDIRPGNWISLMGVNQTTGAFVMKWYRLLSLDDETAEIGVVTTNSLQQGRRAMLIGPDWPASGLVTNATGTALTNLRVAILPDAISVVTKPLRMEDTSLWKLE